MPQWIKEETDREKRAGTKGKFGKATDRKIKAGIKKGGKAEKRAILARTFRRMAQKRKRKKAGARKRT